MICDKFAAKRPILIRDEFLSGIPMGPVRIPWEWEVLV